MTKKMFGLIGAGIFVGGALLSVIFSFVVSNSSSAEFTALSDGTMANLVGGTPQKWNGQHSGGSGSFADCPDSPPCVPSRADYLEYRPDHYGCTGCYSGQQEYYCFPIYKLITSWCDSDGPSSCKYQSDCFEPDNDCQYQTGSTC